MKSSILKKLIIKEMMSIYPFKKSFQKIAKIIADEYGVRLQFIGAEKLDKIVGDELVANISNKSSVLRDDELSYFKSLVCDELRLLGVLKD